MKSTLYLPIEGKSKGYFALLGLLGLFVALGLWAAHHMETEGHYITGMTNEVVWGMPHVFAVFLIVAASGALNVASFSSVFGKLPYKPLSRLAGLVAMALLIGGLTILVLDLGRPDRLVVAMTNYNFLSIFAWNIFLYTGFLVVVALYLWMLMERRMNRYSQAIGIGAFIWRLILTTGTGSIFGFLVAREAYNTALLAPMFIIMSFSFGMAVYLLVLMGLYKGTQRALGEAIITRLRILLGVFVAAVLYFTLVYVLANLYMARNHGSMFFLLKDGGIYPALFWGVQIVLGGIVPLALFFWSKTAPSRRALAIGASLVIIGGFAQLYVLIIGGQAYPLILFPGTEVSSSFFDGIIASYTPSLPEVLLGLGGVALALTMILLAVRVLGFLPDSLADPDVDTEDFNVLKEPSANPAKT